MSDGVQDPHDRLDDPAVPEPKQRLSPVDDSLAKDRDVRRKERDKERDQEGGNPETGEGRWTGEVEGGSWDRMGLGEERSEKGEIGFGGVEKIRWGWLEGSWREAFSIVRRVEQADDPQQFLPKPSCVHPILLKPSSTRRCGFSLLLGREARRFDDELAKGRDETISSLFELGNSGLDFEFSKTEEGAGAVDRLEERCRELVGGEGGGGERWRGRRRGWAGEGREGEESWKEVGRGEGVGRGLGGGSWLGSRLDEVESEWGETLRGGCGREREGK
jgi:hypothetical protein